MRRAVLLVLFVLRQSRTASDINYPKCHDAADDTVNGTADLTDLAPLRIVPAANIPDGSVGRLAVQAPASNYVRVFQRTGGGAAAADWKAIALNSDTWTADALRAGVELRLEGKDIVRDNDVWDGFVDIDFEIRDASGKLVGSDRVRLRVSPFMLYHHLLPAETVYVTAFSDGDSVDFRTDIEAAVAVANAPELVEFWLDDPWTQDFFETGYMSMPAAGGAQKVIRVNFRSPNLYNDSVSNPLRDGGDIVYSELRGVDAAGITQYDPNHNLDMDTLNSFGNTETIPPFTHNGATWPLGRILRGSVSNYYPDPKFSKMIASQAVQAPVFVDTSWLLVSHVDETISFVRAPTAQGWTIVVNDPALAISMLEELNDSGYGATKMFAGRKWMAYNGFEYTAQTTIAGVLGDADVMEETTKAIAAVESQLDILLAATGIRPEDVIRIPFTHWAVDGYSVAYQPGTVNLLYVADDVVAAANPYGPIVDGVDVFRAQMEAEFDKVGITVMWVEDWNLYHRNLGEVHCGTNTTRQIPAAKWWESGR
jgi:protein-arginine deiminase